MSATMNAIHTLLVTLSATELCEVIQRSAELCAGLAQKNQTVVPSPVPLPAPFPAPLPAPARLKRPTSITHLAPLEEKHIDIPKRFAGLLGWGDSEPDRSACRMSCADNVENADDADDADDSDESSTDHTKKRRTMKKCFTDGQRIRHMIRDKIWIGAYDSSKNAIVHNGTVYRTLSMFATAHVHSEHNPNRATPRDGWKNCQCEVKGEWVSTYDLPC